MKTAKIKNIITKKTSEVEDIEVLNKTDLALEVNSHSNEIYRLNEIQRKRIKKSKLQFKEGKGIPYEKVIDETEKWLKEKSSGL